MVATVLAAVVLLLANSVVAGAQTCNEQTAWDHLVQTSATMSGSGGAYAAITGRTERHPSDPCTPYVQSEAWVDGGGSPAVQAASQLADATGYKTSGARWGVQNGHTKHWYVYRHHGNPTLRLLALQGEFGSQHQPGLATSARVHGRSEHLQ